MKNSKRTSRPNQPSVRSTSMERWKDLRFGLFLHWGPVSLRGTEIGWSRGQTVPIKEYDTLYREFNPDRFNADAWVLTAKAAGMKYVVLTVKHHDGFCLWDTRESSYNIMNSPFGRDVVRELSEACRRQGLAFGAYYSTCDWHHPDFPLTGSAGSVIRRKSDLDRYTAYLKAQILELLENYGPLLTLWFDVPQCFDARRGADVIQTARSIQPDILINNRTGARGDYDTPEQRIGGFDIDRPWETCMTIGEQWAWKPKEKLKPLRECLHGLIRTAGGDGNFLFNVGPTSSGIIEARQVSRLKQMGEWLEHYGESIYNSRGGPYLPDETFACTRRANHLYLHLLKPRGTRFQLPGLPARIIGSKLLTGGRVRVKQGYFGRDKLDISFSRKDSDRIDTIIRLDLDQSAKDVHVLHAVHQNEICWVSR